MVWLKRRFRAADCVPYQDKLAHLMLAMPARYSEFAMVSIRTDEVSARDYFISLPLKRIVHCADLQLWLYPRRKEWFAGLVMRVPFPAKKRLVNCNRMTSDLMFGN